MRFTDDVDVGGLPNGPIVDAFDTLLFIVNGWVVVAVPNGFHGCDLVEGVNVNVGLNVVGAVVAAGGWAVKLNMNSIEVVNIFAKNTKNNESLYMSKHV